MQQDNDAKKVARQTKLLKVWDGLHFSLEMLKLCYEPMWGKCNEIRGNPSRAIEVMQSAWTFIDSIHRLRELSHVIPTISDKHPEIRIFLEATQVAEDFRNYIQHLRNELHKPQEIPSPVWGSLSWVDQANPNLSHTAFLGTDIAGTGYSSCGWDISEGRFASNVSLGLKNLSLEFDAMFTAAVRFQKFVEAEVKPAAANMPPQPTGLPMVSFEITQVEGGLEIKTTEGLVLPPGTREIRAPSLVIQASIDGMVRAVCLDDPEPRQGT